jgi:hypothetical protein
MSGCNHEKSEGSSDELLSRDRDSGDVIFIQSRASSATFSVVIDVENSEKPCCVAEWVIRYYS